MGSNTKNNHYIPEWVLRKFRCPTLLELDIFTGKLKQKNPDRAGSARRLWPQDIEDNLTIHDTAAAQIYHDRIEGREVIRLSDDEKMAFARWLSHFAVRIPMIREKFAEMIADEWKNPTIIKTTVHKIRSPLLEKIKYKEPEFYQRLVQDVGREEAENLILDQLADSIAASGRFRPKAADVHHMHMRHCSSEKFAKILCRYCWNWFRTDGAFVIGDNPLVRWHEKSKRWDYGINRTGVEITFPLTLQLCLRLTKSVRRNPTVVKNCTPEMTRIYNERQRLAAAKCVYGHTAETLDFIHTPVTSWSGNQTS